MFNLPVIDFYFLVSLCISVLIVRVGDFGIEERIAGFNFVYYRDIKLKMLESASVVHSQCKLINAAERELEIRGLARA